jgi:hypothetical protein
MLFLTTEMVAPQMTAALNTRYDTARRALAEEGLPLGSRPEAQARRTARRDDGPCARPTRRFRLDRLGQLRMGKDN